MNPRYPAALVGVLLAVASVLLSVPGFASAGEVTVGSADLSVVDGGGTSWLPDTAPYAGETDQGGLHVWVDVTGSALWGTALRLHASCGTPAGAVVTSWSASSAFTRSTAGAVDAGSPGCVATGGTGWLLRVWVARDSDGHVEWEWRSDHALHPAGTDCPAGTPAGMQCVWAVNASLSPSPAVSCPVDVTTDYPCVYAVNEASVAPADVTPITDGITALRGSLVAGIAILVFLASAALIMRFRKSS